MCVCVCVCVCMCACACACACVRAVGERLSLHVCGGVSVSYISILKVAH